MSKTKLELTWIGKDKRPKLEPRILLEDPELSYHANHKISENDIFDNKLIFGDNLLALKALEQEYTGKIRCIYLDPPYNTGSAFEHYDDGLEHSLWLSLIRERLIICHSLLAKNGSIWISIDDNEAHYLKVVLDEIFGRKNFVSTVVWQKKYGPKSDSKFLSESHDFILVYAKDIESLKLNRVKKTEKQNSRYKNPDNDPRGPWKPGDTLRNEVRDYAVFPVTLPNGEIVWPSDGTSWRYTQEKFAELISDNRIWFGKTGSSRPAIKRFLSEVTDTMPAQTIWTYDEVGHNDESKKESKALFGASVFGTPKPERLIQRVIELASDLGDVVLDSFAGSGTTGAVAHKMGRRWIMVELGEHNHTHIIPRLQKVIDGEDQGGISKSVHWQGGGGFRYYKLAPSLIEYDRFGQPVINKEFNAEMLTEAVCKLEGFTYAPSDTIWWQHGYSTETDFIYVTTQNLSVEQLEQISEEVGSDKTLLVMCGAFRCKADRFANLTIKKLPKAVLKHCEWAHDDYSLNVQNLPMAERDPEQEDLF
ncbi:MAG: site-specific DNA-methyltransferase [Pelagibaca sp.]|nr:site-specific DNA-methyltransferase [Pelagibaca sp.]